MITNRQKTNLWMRRQCIYC